MSVLISQKAINDLKWCYNYNLGRYYKGCKYCENHREEYDKWSESLLEILDNMNVLLDELMKYTKVSDEEILKGFKQDADK